MGRPVRAEIYLADREMGRFIRYQHAEAMRLGYPTMATFARDIARGTIGPAPLTEADPIMDTVGEFFHRLKEIERRVMSDRYGSGLTERERAKAIGISVRHLRRKTEAILLRCAQKLSMVDMS